MSRNIIAKALLAPWNEPEQRKRTRIVTTTAVKLQDFDPAEYLDTAESQQALLEDAFETGDRAYILNAMGIVARARGMSGLQKQTGLNRATLYAALSEEGNPTFETMLAVLNALGLKMAVKPAGSSELEAA